MKESLQKALDNVELTYTEIAEIANELIAEYTSDITSIISYTSDNIENLPNDDLRSLMLRLSIKAYSFGDVKEKAAIKSQCAEMLRKEAYAKAFNSLDGSVASKDSNATIQISNEVVSEAVYDLVASLFKVKMEEIRRMIDTLKTVLMSRLSEAKLSSTITEGMEG